MATINLLTAKVAAAVEGGVGVEGGEEEEVEAMGQVREAVGALWQCVRCVTGQGGREEAEVRCRCLFLVGDMTDSYVIVGDMTDSYVICLFLFAVYLYLSRCLFLDVSY